ncbi:MAG: hypothetical protein EOM24_13510 [Chloroflexia bacterium]|nr:hypothetical protein [Chloroflexia bacterium]
MSNPFRAFGNAVRDLFDEILVLTVCNLIWALLCLPTWIFANFLLGEGEPLLAGVTLLAGILPTGPATAGLAFVAYRVVDGRAVKLNDYFEGMRQYARSGWLLAAIWMTGFVTIIFNLNFYGGGESIFSVLMVVFWFYMLLFWLATLIYAPALVHLQEQPTLRVLVRNTFFMVMGRPIYTLVTLVLMGLFFGLSLVLIIVPLMITFSFFAVWGARATKQLVDEARRRREEAAGAQPTSNVSEERGRKGQVRPK